MKFVMYRAKIEVSLKPGHLDPEGEMTGQSLRELKYSVESVSVGKVYEVSFEAGSAEEAEKQVDEMCSRLLANPTKDDYRFEIEEAK
jgi:phosphoribosylformylglycinamidine synthase PurS subunit